MKTINILNKLKELEEKHAARKGHPRLGDPAVEAERCRLLRWKLHTMRPDRKWTAEDESSYQEQLSRLPALPPLTDREKRRMAHIPGVDVEALVSVLKARLAGILPRNPRAPIPTEPLIDPKPSRTAESPEVEKPPHLDPEDKSQGAEDLPFFQND